MRMKLPIGAAILAASFGLTTGAVVLTAGGALAANAIQKECSTKYQAAKAANQLNGLNYNQYYKQCAAAAKASPAAPAPTPAATPKAAPAPAPAPAPTTTAKRRTAPPVATGTAVFPTAIAPEFAKETAGKARMHTCLAQYKQNGSKGGPANGGLNWIEKGGGYYSECNKKLKG